MHTLRREIAHYSGTKLATPGTPVKLQHPCIFVCQIEQRHENKNITFNDTFHSLSLQSNKICMLWWWLIIYDQCNLQRSGSNVHTKNALLKLNLVATLNPTWAYSYFVMVSQKVITYCYKNIDPQVHRVIQYRHHMLIAQLPWFSQ
jgi:hypothetical protein